MLRKLLTLTIFLSIITQLSSQIIHVTGQYLDKKQNPIEQALVSYFAQGDLLLDSTRSLVDGSFDLELDLTGINTNRKSNDPFVKIPYPNPFNGLCNFSLSLDGKADIVISNMQGIMVDKHRIKSPGVYYCTWGGQNRIGQSVNNGTYNVTVITNNSTITHKVIFNGNSSQRIVSQKVANNSFKSGEREQDRINFLKEKTSELDLLINPLSGDTTLGVITGNAGPDALSNIIAIVSISNNNTWNLNNYFYNDDQSIYQTTDPNFTISNDSIMTFTGSETGTYVFEVIATDAFDGSLMDTVNAEITVTDGPVVVISGTYIDHKNNAIDAADVVYYESGTTNIAQTITDANGYFELTIATSKNVLTYDMLEFSKTNTTTLELWMYTPTADTSLGNIIGNVGPENTQTLIANVHIDSLVTWNLNNYFYNDDQSQYTIDDNTNFEIQQDSLLAFIGGSPGDYTPTITATDTADNTLSAQMTTQITIRNEQHINVSGTYADNATNPIQSAYVAYYEDVTNLLGEDNTNANGFYSMDVTVLPGHDGSLTFTKINTTELQIDFPTPAGDTVIDANGNLGPEELGNINETRFTIEAPLIWNLNNYFTNDDQSIYTQPDPDFSIVEDTLLRNEGEIGTYSTTVTATDPQDASLTAQQSTDVEVQYTINIPDTTIIEDYQNDTLFANLNQYINPNYTYGLNYAVVSQSNNTLIDLYAQDSTILINSLQPDSSGSSYVGIEITGNGNVDTVYFTVTVNAMPDISGYVTDIFDTLNTGLAGVVVELTLDSITFYYATTDANGYYSIQLPAPTQTVYYRAALSKTGFTHFHSWAVVESGSNNMSIDYTIVPSSFVWDLYNNGFRDNAGLTGIGFNLDQADTTRHWISPPLMHTFSDNSGVGGGDITVEYANLVYNIQNILPTFNPRDAIPSNLVEHSEPHSGFTLQDNEHEAYFDNVVLPDDSGWTLRSYDGPKMNQCSDLFADGVGSNGADTTVLNQELGSCFGAVTEPAQSSTYDSVFTDPTSENTYTQDDYDCSIVMLDRARVHYRNISYALSDPEGFDWEMRPDEVLIWYPGTSKKSSKTYVFTRYTQNGEIISKTYKEGEVPLFVMKAFKHQFTPAQIAACEKKEAQLGFKLNKWFSKNSRPKQAYSPKQHTKPLTKRELRKAKRRMKKAQRRNKRATLSFRP